MDKFSLLTTNRGSDPNDEDGINQDVRQLRGKKEKIGKKWT